MDKSIFTDKQIENLTKNLTRIRGALANIETGIHSEDYINQFRSGDILIALTKAFEIIIELQTDSVTNTINMLKTVYNMDVSIINDVEIH
jgi:predicted Zn-dependent protease